MILKKYKETIKKISLEDIINCIGEQKYTTMGNKNICVTAVAPINEAIEGALTFCTFVDEKGITLIRESKASIIICQVKLADYFINSPCAGTLLFVNNPRLSFMRAIKKFFVSEDTSVEIHPSVIIGHDCTVGVNISVGKNTIIGNNVRIGDNSRIFENVIIKDNVCIGERVIIYENCLIGQTGFSFERDDTGLLEYLPNIGKVVIEDDVEIFPFTNVDRGTISTTRIRKGTKIDHYCHIGHNVEIGTDCIICAGVILAGGVVIGEQCFLGINSLIKNKVKVGNNVTIGMGAIVINDVPDFSTVFGG